MKIFIGRRNDINVEIYSILSQFNYVSGENYSIDTAILEKRLMHDTLIRDGKIIIYNISDLKAYYDR